MNIKNITKYGAAIVAVAALSACGESPDGTDTASSGGVDPSNPTNLVATDDTLTIDKNSPLNTVDVLANDQSDAPTISLVSVDSVSANGGKVRLNDTGDQIIYEPPINYTGQDTVEYTVTDGTATTTATLVVTIGDLVTGVRPCILEADARMAEGRPYCADVFIPAADGHGIAATVFVPADNGAQKPPLIVHAHGFGESRFASLENPSFVMVDRVTAQSLLELWHEGYWVITYDQRGFSASVLWGPQTPSASNNGEAVCLGSDDPNCVDVMNPEREGRDLSDVIDWAVDNLREGFDVTTGLGAATFNGAGGTGEALFAEGAVNDPIMGTIGLSYGGGFQTVGTPVDAVLNGGDTRVDTVVPVTTWFDLRYSLAPNDVIKSGWLEFLALASNLGGVTPALGGFLTQAGTQALLLDDVSPAAFDGLYVRSVRSYCEGNGDNTLGDDADLVPAVGTGTMPNNTPSAFFIQGQRDLLFNYNEAFDMARCFEDAGSPDVRLLIETEGHILSATGTQPASYHGADAIIYIDETVYCDSAGAAPLSTRELISGWFREKLGVIAHPSLPLNANQIPKVCTTHFLPGAAPASGSSFASLNDVAEGDPTAGSYTYSLDANQALAGVQNITFALPSAIPGGSLFDQTLLTAAQTLEISGIPLLQLDVQATGTPDLVEGATVIDPPRFFVSLGVQRSGSNTVDIIADQVTPISGPGVTLSGCLLNPAGCVTSNFTYPRADGKYPEQVGDTIGKMSGFSVKLEAGDALVLRITGLELLYNLHSTTTGVYSITLSGNVQIPVVQ